MLNRAIRICLFDLGAALLFFGALSQQLEPAQTGRDALTELATRGYKLPSEDDPVRVFPALTSGKFSGGHAGGWRPGSIYLRQQPQGGLSASVYLRHELFHEVNHRSCGGRLPGWAEEAAAMHFSGELIGMLDATAPADNALQSLKNHVQQGMELDAKDRLVLGRLVESSGWPSEPCAISKPLSDLLGVAFDDSGDRAHLLISMISGRTLESSGDQISRTPPGSLLKIPYAAAVSQANPHVLGAELAASDTDKLLQRQEYFQAERYRLLLSPVKEQTLQYPPADRLSWRAYLGERSSNGNFALQATLRELALSMRAALLSRPDYFLGLSQNGFAPNSTLAGQAQANKKLLRELQAMSKTGTASSENGQPLIGHLLVAWPMSHPVFLAIFRQRGVNGATVLSQASPLLKSWQQQYPPRFATVRVSLLTPTDQSSWQADADCPELQNQGSRFSVCGRFNIVSTAHGSRSERVVNGILHRATDQRPTVLETDAESYVDAVLAAEAQTLSGSARQAMRAVIAWNGSHGSHRHSDSASLCDTTHCMVFLGALPSDKPPHASHIDLNLLLLLDKLATEAHLNWLPFANGGEQRWHQRRAAKDLQEIFAENQILEIRRERRKDGELFIRLFYPDDEEAISCEIFRNTLKLPSCPDSVTTTDHQVWQFQGIGAGHGLGLSIVRAQALAEAGRNAEQILRDAFEQKR